MRDTSIQTLNEIKASGLLSRRRMEVYEVLFYHGPMTQNETVRYYQRVYPGCNAAGWNARFAELERMNAIQEVGRKNDEISGHEVTVWDVTSRLPVPLDKKKTKKKLSDELISAIVSLGKEVDNLKWKSQLRDMYKMILELTQKNKDHA